MPHTDPTPTSLARLINRDFNVGFHAFTEWQPRLERIFADLTYSTARHFDLEETETAFLLTLELPGFKQDDVEISLDKDVLTVSAKRGERSYHQSVIVPEDVDPDRVEAKLEDGLLALSLGKLPLLKPRKIDVK